MDEENKRMSKSCPYDVLRLRGIPLLFGDSNARLPQQHYQNQLKILVTSKLYGSPRYNKPGKDDPKTTLRPKIHNLLIQR